MMTRIERGGYLHRLREQRGLHLSQVSRGLGINYTTLRNIEAGVSDGQLYDLQRLEEFYHLPAGLLSATVRTRPTVSDVAELRKACGLSLKQVARAMLLTLNTVLNIEHQKAEGTTRLYEPTLRTYLEMYSRMGDPIGGNTPEEDSPFARQCLLRLGDG